jgi:hypothetical protein
MAGNVKLPRYSWGQEGGPTLGSATEDANALPHKETKRDFMKEGVTFKQSSDEGGPGKPTGGFVDKSLDKKTAYNMDLYYNK